jgi:1-aminocyclopropane-1-carboxylate deaminase/D-cysteine desulfhydrase-like pyridoxal-dependent ACC family enzyme
LNLQCIGIIRGEEHIPLNHTLDFATKQGMKIYYLDRGAYRKKNSNALLDGLRGRFGDFFIIPEGGTNALAVKGCAEFAERELLNVNFDHIALAVGTGGTMAGLVCAFKGKRNIIGIPVLKQGDFLKSEIKNFVKEFSSAEYSNWSLLTEYHHGGYGKVTPSLMHFISEMKASYDLPLDHVYTAKVVWGVIDQVKNGAFSRGETILILHTGGLQGTRSIGHEQIVKQS